MAQIKRIAERVLAPFAGSTVDREKGVLKGVKLCGLVSENDRDYLPTAFKKDVNKYEGVAIYTDHSQEQRQVEDKLGWISNPRIASDGTPIGDANLLKTHPLYERVMEAAERNPALYGFSHVAMCHTSMKGAREQVEGLEKIESVDLVAEPATTKGLFESKGKRVGYTVAKLVEWVVKHPKSTTKQIVKIKTLTEEDSGMYAGADMAGVSDAGPDAQCEPEDAITAGFKAALMSVVEKALAGDLDPKAALAKIKTLLAAHGNATADGDGGGAGTDDEGKPSSEGKGKGKATGDDSGKRFSEAAKELEKAGIPLKASLINMVANTSGADRIELIATLKESVVASGTGGAEKVTGAGGADQVRLAEQKRQEAAAAAGAIPTEGEKFAKYIQE